MKNSGPGLVLGIRKHYSKEFQFIFFFLSFFSATSAILTAEQLLYATVYQIPIIVKDSFNRACELPQIVQLEACDCDYNHICLYSSTTGINTGDGSSVTSDIDGTITEDQIEGSNVGLGPTGIGMIALGLLLLLCKYWIESPFSALLQNKNVTRLTGMPRFIWPFLFGIYSNSCGNLEVNNGANKGMCLFNSYS